jgi:hypothetical protein
MKRTAALSIQTIIIAAVGILVLSVLAYLLIGAGNDTEEGISCASEGGVCGNCDSDEVVSQDASCSEGRCCQPLAVDAGSG